MAWPTLTEWEATRNALHKASQVVGALRAVTIPPLPNDLHVSLYVAPNGLSTGPLNIGGELTFDFTIGTLVYNVAGENVFRVPIAGHTQVSLTDALLEALVAVGQVAMPRRQKIADTAPLLFDLGLASDYAQVMNHIYNAMARFRGRLWGMMTPIVLWPHHFDLSFLWFATPKADEHQDPHINFGFAPMSEGFPRPYLYIYAWPMAEGMADVQPLAPSRWYRGSWAGVTLDYADLLEADQPEALIEAVLWHFYQQVAPLLTD